MIRKARDCVAELVRRRPLARHGAETDIGGFRMVARGDLTAHLLTERNGADHAAAIRLGPHDWLFVGTGEAMPAPRAPSTLFQDMTSAYAFIDVAGAGVVDRLGLAGLIGVGPPGFVTRLADLRVVVGLDVEDADHVRIVVDRSSADYMWEWLAARLADIG